MATQKRNQELVSILSADFVRNTTDDVARLATAQTFTTVQTVTPSNTSVNGITINMPSSTTGLAVEIQYNSVKAAETSIAASDHHYALTSFDNGSSYGPYFSLGINNNGGTPAAGFLLISARTGTGYRVWPDNTGNLRIGTSNPTNANDTTGTVIGTQTSWHELKENITRYLQTDDMLNAVLNLHLYNYEMRTDSYKNNDGTKPHYTGIVITNEDRECNAWFAANLGEGQIPVLNERNLFGYLVGAIQALSRKIDNLEKLLECR